VSFAREELPVEISRNNKPIKPFGGKAVAKSLSLSECRIEEVELRVEPRSGSLVFVLEPVLSAGHIFVKVAATSAMLKELCKRELP
jgi:hypothetical protein